MMKRYLMVAALAVVLAGCSSRARVDPPLEAAQANPATCAACAAREAKSAQVVEPVVVTQTQDDPNLGPQGVGRVILFDFDSYVIKPEYQSVIEQHARYLQENPNRSVSLEGHADERGSREYNLALGQKRAEAVRRALTLVGASDKQLEAVSFGEENPADPGHDEDAWAQNRRVELRYR
ncbi:MAG: peptidoglycan-associated lipoprotein Pal [Burkholderiaceae bacterium]|jgi:peptidoglycan-associated lipoprotein|nr:peptidoglycan-associated lipoprotein Pal [Burkholderiaceae bacterium]